MMNLRNESLKVKNEVISKIKEKFNVCFDYSFNDLYWVEKNSVEVRRLKGCMWDKSDWYYEDRNKEFEKLFLEVKEFIESLEYKDFKLEFNKIRNDISLNKFLKVYKNKDNFINLSFDEYKKKVYDEERVLILKISYIK